MNVSSGTTNTEVKVKKKLGRPKKVKTFQDAMSTPSFWERMDKDQDKKKTRKKWTRRAKAPEPQPTKPFVLEYIAKGPKPEPQSGFTVKDVLAIIKAGNESNLLSFDYKGLILSFKSPTAILDLPKAVSKTSERKTQEKSEAPIPAGIQGWNSEADQNVREELDDLFLSDPQRAEQVMIDSFDQTRENASNEREIS